MFFVGNMDGEICYVGAKFDDCGDFHHLTQVRPDELHDLDGVVVDWEKIDADESGDRFYVATYSPKGERFSIFGLQFTGNDGKVSTALSLIPVFPICHSTLWRYQDDHLVIPSLGATAFRLEALKPDLTHACLRDSLLSHGLK